jgi:hypothetical protein
MLQLRLIREDVEVVLNTFKIKHEIEDLKK